MEQEEKYTYIITSFDKDKKVLEQIELETSDLYETNIKAVEFALRKDCLFVYVVDDLSNNVIRTLTPKDAETLMEYEVWLRILLELFISANEETQLKFLNKEINIKGIEYLNSFLESGITEEEFKKIYNSNIKSLPFMHYLNVSVYKVLEEAKKES